jgi:hypothetical protein
MERAGSLQASVPSGGSAMSSETVMGVVSGLSNLATAVIAGYGLFTWRMQYRAQVNFELARNLSRATNNIEAAIRGVRSTASIYDDTGVENSDRTESEEKRYQAKKREMLEDAYSKFRLAMENLRDSSREAEMVWGGTAVRNAMVYIEAIDNELWLALYHITGQAGVDGAEQSQREAQESLQRLLHVYGKDDPFGKTITNAVHRIKAVADPHLKL